MNRYHTFGKRLLALIVDTIVFSPLVALYLWLSTADISEWILVALGQVWAIVGVTYNILLHWNYGQTVGKMLARVRVLSVSEQPISFKQALLREIGYITTEGIWIIALLWLFALGYSWSSETIVWADQYISISVFVWLAIDTLVCIKSKKYRALHDHIAGTLVVRLDIPNEEDINRHEPPGPEHYKDL